MIVPAVHRCDAGAAMARLAQIEPNIDLGTNSVRRIALTSSTVTGHIEKRS